MGRHSGKAFDFIKTSRLLLQCPLVTDHQQEPLFCEGGSA